MAGNQALAPQQLTSGLSLEMMTLAAERYLSLQLPGSHWFPSFVRRNVDFKFVPLGIQQLVKFPRSFTMKVSSIEKGTSP